MDGAQLLHRRDDAVARPPAALATDLELEERWAVDGRHYARSAEAWLARLDASRDELLGVLADRYGGAAAERRLQTWRVFFMACAELWGYRGGTEWGVSHYRFARGAVAEPR